MTTIGYGDISPKTVFGKAFTVIFVVAALVRTAAHLRSPSRASKIDGYKAFQITHIGGSMRGLEPGMVTCTKRRTICYPYNRHLLQARAPLNRSVMACRSLERTQADPLCLSENSIS